MLYTPECFMEYRNAERNGGGGGAGMGSDTGGGKNGKSGKKDSSSSSEKTKGKDKGKDAAKAKVKSEGGVDGTGGKAVYFGVDDARKRVALKCTSCGLQGALIGCHVSSCQVNTHYACAIREGWKFGDEPDVEGKVCSPRVLRCVW